MKIKSYDKLNLMNCNI